MTGQGYTDCQSQEKSTQLPGGIPLWLPLHSHTSTVSLYKEIYDITSSLLQMKRLCRGSGENELPFIDQDKRKQRKKEKGQKAGWDFT